MQSISDIIQALARQRGRTDMSPLGLLRPLEGRPGDRISHLPVGGELEQAWLAMTGEPFRPHQSQALTALRRGEPVALRAESSAVTGTLTLLAYALLTSEPGAAALALTYDGLAARTLHERLTRINAALPQQLRLSVTNVTEKQPNPYARIVICPAEMLHARLLRHHDRAWELLWARLRALMLPDIQRFAGVPGAHLADLLLRLRRVAAAHGAPLPIPTVATLTGVGAPEAALTAALGAPWRIVSADDDQLRETTFAVWRGGPARLRDAADIALALQRNGYFVHIACDSLERAVISPIIGDIPAISIGSEPPETQALVIVGAVSVAQLRRLLRSGYNAVVLVLGEQMHEQMLARQPDLLLTAPASEWPPTPANAYVTAQHVLCAANELPLTVHEVESWGAQEIIERLVEAEQLVDLPDAEVCWKPGPQADDPYPEFHLLAPSGAAIQARSEQGRSLGQLDPTGFERWTFPGATLPPLAGGVRVLSRDEEHAQVTLRLESAAHRTLPLRRGSVTVREVRQNRSLAGGAALAWGRVVVEEEIYGYREQAPGAQPAEHAINPPLKTRWIAPACWFQLSSGLQVQGQQIGWSLAAALPLRALASFTDLTPCYDPEQRRMYLVDSHPGGNGAAVWLFSNAEQLLTLAYDIAHACRNDPLFEPLSRIDMDWLLALLGRAAPEQRRAAEPARAEAAARLPAEQRSSARPPASESPFLEIPPRQQRAGTPRPERGAEPPTERPRRSEPNQARFDAPAPEPPARTSRPAPEAPPPTTPPARTSRPAPEVPPPATSPAERHRRPDPAPPATPARRESPSPGPPPGRPARQEPAGAPPQRPPARQEPAEQEGPPDPAALIARLRRQRQQREGDQPPPTATPRQPSARSSQPVIARFKAGDRVFCLPYGDGVVSESRIEDDRELLVVAFPEHGELEIDPAVNLVRQMRSPSEMEDDLL